MNPLQPNHPKGFDASATLRLRSTPPHNLDAFIREIADGISATYGPAAAAAYSERAHRGFGATLATPGSAIFSVDVAGGDAAAMLLAIPRDNVVDFSLIHVLAPHVGHGMEQALVAAATRHYRDAGADVLLSESLPCAPMALDEAFAAAGFDAVPRGLFHCAAESLHADSREASDLAVHGTAIRPSDFGGVAECIAAAYDGHPGRWLHPELRNPEDARMLVLRMLAGAYGPVLPNYCRVYRVGDSINGALLGCEVAPGVGFVVQLVVAPAARGQGIATCLMLEFAEACRAAGVPTIALGVTLDNPARKLYERLGFKLLRPITAYTWWREGEGRK